MTQSIEEFKHIEKIKLCYLKHRGNILAISDELQLPLDYIKKMVDKFRKKEDRDIKTLIANTLMSHIFLGYESRVHNLMEMWRSLLGKEKVVVSICCEKPVKKYEVPNAQGKVYECLSCHLGTDIEFINEEGILDLKMGILEQLRGEDIALVDFAERMGYTNKTFEPPLVGSLHQNILVMGSDKDNKIIEDYSKLSPMDRQKLIDMIDIQISEENKPKIDDNQNQT